MLRYALLPSIWRFVPTRDERAKALSTNGLLPSLVSTPFALSSPHSGRIEGLQNFNCVF
jgi:hypothetical protein